MIFAVLDPSPLTVCINCSFLAFISYITPKSAPKRVQLNKGRRQLLPSTDVVKQYCVVSCPTVQQHYGVALLSLYRVPVSRSNNSGHVVIGGQCTGGAGDALLEPRWSLLSSCSDLRAGLPGQRQDSAALRHAARCD